MKWLLKKKEIQSRMISLDIFWVNNSKKESTLGCFWSIVLREVWQIESKIIIPSI